MAVLKWPGPADRTAVVGRTGSGKTVAGVWHLSGKDFTNPQGQPWAVFNTKGDPLLNEIAAIEGVKNIALDKTPEEPGLYIYNTVPGDADAINDALGRIWQRQNCGVYIDEGYMIENDDNLNALLTQGRSRNCPVIMLSQRPAWITKYMFSEADFVQLFNLQIQDDRKKIKQLVPVDKDYSLRKHHSYWYNVGDDILTPLGPVPPPDELVERIRAKFSAKNAPEPLQAFETVDVSPAEKVRRYL